MTLGERISKYRKAQALSQEDLANLLNVSRQSVYKWESNLSTPELEKLIALSNIFNVSLDELVKGDTPIVSDNSKADSVQTNKKGIVRIVIGAISLALGILILLVAIPQGMWSFQGLLGAVLYGVPFVAIGLICLLAKRYIGLKCAWALYISVSAYVKYFTSISASYVKYTFEWTKQMNYTRLAFAWVLFIITVVLIAATVISLLKNHKIKKNDVAVIIVCAISLLLVKYIPIGKYLLRNPSFAANYHSIYVLHTISLIKSFINSWLLIIILVRLIPIIRNKLKKKI